MAKQVKQVPVRKIKVVNMFNYENNERTCEQCFGPSQTEPDTSYSIEELYQRALQGIENFGPLDHDYDDHFDSPDLHELNALDISERYEVLKEWESRLRDKTEIYRAAKQAELDSLKESESSKEEEEPKKE